MASAPTRYVVCEGPDDLGALRALVREIEPGCRPRGSKHERKVEISTSGMTLVLVAAEGAKSALAARVLDLAEGTAEQRTDAIGVVFDPDSDRPDREFAFFKKDYDQLSVDQQRGSRLRRRKSEFVVTIGKREVRIIPGPWRPSQPAGFDDLPGDEQNLERVLIGGILGASIEPSLQDWALESTRALRTLVRDHGWKRAFRIWNAGLQPKSESFVDKLLESPDTKRACLDELLTTPVADLLRELLAHSG